MTHGWDSIVPRLAVIVALVSEIIIHPFNLSQARLLAGDGCGQITDPFLYQFLTMLVWLLLPVSLAVAVLIWRQPTSRASRLLTPSLTLWFGVALFWGLVPHFSFGSTSSCDVNFGSLLATVLQWVMITNLAFVLISHITNRD